MPGREALPRTPGDAMLPPINWKAALGDFWIRVALGFMLGLLLSRLFQF